VGNSKPRVCRECKQAVAKGIKMTKHWQEMHPEKFATIKAWLADCESKIKAAEAVANEGMRGPSADGNVFKTGRNN